MIRFLILLENRALEDIEECLEYYSNVKIGLDKKFKVAINNEFKTISNNPFFQIRYGRIRCKTIKGFPFLIHYDINELQKIVFVYAIINTSKNPDLSWLSK